MKQTLYILKRLMLFKAFDCISITEDGSPYIAQPWGRFAFRTKCFRQKQILQGIKYKPYTENTIQDQRFYSQSWKNNPKGWAVDNEEHESGIRCIAAPVKDFTRKVIAGLSIFGR
jgi:hypothetical protein